MRRQVEAAMQRQDDLRAQESAHVREIMELRATHYQELRQIETGRLDAIRLVDVATTQRTAEVQAALQQTLAAQLVTTADAFRTSLSGELEPIRKDIRELRDAQSKGVGGKEQTAESRVNVNLVVVVVTVLIAAVTLILYVVKK